jgi:hypothetical protein
MTATVRSHASTTTASGNVRQCAMSAYQLQQFLFDRLRDAAAMPENYSLDAAESSAISDNDIAALFQLGVHPVLLNSWCRATGYTRDAYREILAPLAPPKQGVGRWHNS